MGYKSSAAGSQGLADAMLALGTGIAACQRRWVMDEVVRLTSAIGTGVAYYPDYLAQELGYFEDEGLAVRTDAPGDGTVVARMLVSGEAHIGLGGMWRALLPRKLSMFYCFAQLVDRYSGVLLSRPTGEAFAWPQLLGRTVLIPGGNPSAYILFQYLLRRAGVDQSCVRFLHTFAAPEATGHFRLGVADYYLTGQPASDVLISEGVGKIATTLAEGGRMPASVYYATPAFLNREDNAAGRFVKAIERGLRWIAGHDPTEASVVFERRWPALSSDLVAESIRWCKATGV